MHSKNRLKKGRQKRRRSRTSGVECGGLRAASRNARFLLRKAFARLTETSLYTPALPAECDGLSSHTRRPPHSTKLLSLIYAKKQIRVLAVSGRMLAIHGRILHQKMQPRLQNKLPRNHQTSSKTSSQDTKIHQNFQKWLPGKKNSPQDRKRSEKGARGDELLTLSLIHI